MKFKDNKDGTVIITDVSQGEAHLIRSLFMGIVFPQQEDDKIVPLLLDLMQKSRFSIEYSAFVDFSHNICDIMSRVNFGKYSVPIQGGRVTAKSIIDAMI